VLRNSQLPSSGQLIDGKFRIVRQLGAGGMGVVFEAVNESTERHVALKFLAPALSSTVEPTERFKREAKATARIHHPNVVAVQDFGEHDGRLYLVLELLKGRSLREWLLERPLNFEDACKVLIPVLRGVAAAHAVGVLHRDLKPDNVFMTDSADGLEPVPKVLDFGLAKLTSATDAKGTDLSATGSAMGTYQFMAPEQLRGLGEIDARADVYAVGAILFNMVTGTTPYRADNPVDLAIQIIGSEAPSLDSLVRVPPGAAAVVARALARERNARYGSIEELAVALEPFAGGMLFRGGRSAPPGPRRATPASIRPGAESSVTPLGTPFHAHSDDETVYPLPRRYGAGAWLAIALGLSVAIGGTILLVGLRSSHTAASRSGAVHHLPASLPSSPSERAQQPEAPVAPRLPTAPEPESSHGPLEVAPSTPEQRLVVPAWPDPWQSSKPSKGSTRERRAHDDRREDGQQQRLPRASKSVLQSDPRPLIPPASIEPEPPAPVPPKQAPPSSPPTRQRSRSATPLTTDDF
jgi:serine/threonine protein kinase